MATPFDLYAVIDRIRQRPGMYFGVPSLTRLRAFLDGCVFAVDECGGKIVSNPEFGELHDWVATRFGWRESTAGWCNILLAGCGNDEAKALALFFDLIDEYRRR